MPFPLVRKSQTHLPAVLLASILWFPGNRGLLAHLARRGQVQHFQIARSAINFLRPAAIATTEHRNVHNISVPAELLPDLQIFMIASVVVISRRSSLVGLPLALMDR